MPKTYSMSKKVKWDGLYQGRVRYVDERTCWQLKEVERILGHPIVMYQGSWSNGSLSADTHAGAGAADIGPTGPVTWRQLETACRTVGLAAWFRPWLNNYHCHVLSIGNPGLASWAKVQVNAYFAGYDGLGGNARAARDTGVRNYVTRTWTTYIAGRPAAATTDTEEGVLGMAKHVYKRNQRDQKLKKDKPVTLKIDKDGDDVSVTTKAQPLVALQAHAQASGLKAGVRVEACWQRVHWSKGKTIVDHSFKPIYLTADNPSGQVDFTCNVPAAPKGFSSRMRVVACAKGGDATITDLQIMGGTTV